MSHVLCCSHLTPMTYTPADSPVCCDVKAGGWQDVPSGALVTQASLCLLSGKGSVLHQDHGRGAELCGEPSG